MPSSLSRRSKLLVAAVALVLLAHGATPLANPRVRRLGLLFTCQCGCYESVTECQMMNCHSSGPLREELQQMVEAGKSDQQITDAFVAEYGLKILRKPPAEGFYLSAWVMPFVATAIGLVILTLVLRYMLRRRTAAAVVAPSPDLERYREQIEKETEDL